MSEDDLYTNQSKVLKTLLEGSDKIVKEWTSIVEENNRTKEKNIESLTGSVLVLKDIEKLVGGLRVEAGNIQKILGDLENP
jgi:hypothetical protein